VLKRRVENEEEDVKDDPSPISSPFSSNVNVVGVEDQKLRDEEQDEKIQEMEEMIQMLLERDQKREKELEELKSQSKANNNKNERGEDGMSQIDPTLDVMSDVSKMKTKQENIRTQVGNHEDTLDEHGNEIMELKGENQQLMEEIEELKREEMIKKKADKFGCFNLNDFYRNKIYPINKQMIEKRDKITPNKESI